MTPAGPSPSPHWTGAAASSVRTDAEDHTHMRAVVRGAHDRYRSGTFRQANRSGTSPRCRSGRSGRPAADESSGTPAAEDAADPTRRRTAHGDVSSNYDPPLEKAAPDGGGTFGFRECSEEDQAQLAEWPAVELCGGLNRDRLAAVVVARCRTDRLEPPVPGRIAGWWARRSAPSRNGSVWPPWAGCRRRPARCRPTSSSSTPLVSTPSPTSPTDCPLSRATAYQVSPRCTVI